MSEFGAEAMSRRHLIQLTGGAGLLAIVGACSTRTTQAPGEASVSSNAASSKPFPTGLSTTPMPLVTNETGTPAADLGTMLCRESWGARPARPGGRVHTINRMTVHHTAVVLGDNRNSPGRLRQHQRYHMDVKGWIDIAYHVGVDRDGNIYELRSTKLAGDTATDYDTTGHFLVVCEGDFDQEPLSDAQFEGAAIAFAWAAQNFDVLPDTLASHREVTPTTSCPGTNLEARVVSGDLRKRVSEILGLGKVGLPLICGGEATETVARIEAGQ